jgi:signal transduction histidine kinase
VENARLFGSEQSRASEMEALVEIAQAVTEAVTERPKALLERIARGACEALRADCAIVYPFVASQPDTYDVANVATFGTLHSPELGQSKVTAHDPTRVIRKRKLLACEDVACDRPSLFHGPFFERESVRSFVGVLLEADEDELGVLYVNYRAPHRFEEHELTSVRLIAHQAALAIAKSRLFQTLNRDLVQANAELRRKVREMEELQTINNVISSTLEIDKVWDRILEGAVSVTGVPSANILLLDEESGNVIARVREGNETRTQEIDPREIVVPPRMAELEERAAIFQGSTGPPAGEIPWVLIHWRLIPDARSVRYTPILSGSEQDPLGLLVISSPEPDALGPDDLRLLEALANQASIAIQNARYLQTMRQYTVELEELDRRRSGFLSTVSHELRTPLTPVKSCVENMLSEMYGPVTEKQRSRLEIALASINEETRLVENLLDLVRIQENRVTLDLEYGDVADIVRSVIQVFEYDVDRKRIELRADLPAGDTLRTRLDRGKVKQVLTNLISNAIKFTPERGTITVSASSDENWVKVQVRDTGIGIPADEQARVFDRFYQVDSSLTRRVGGTGIGLSIVKEYVEMHSGEVGVQSELGKGSTFTFTLPRRAGTL